MSDTHSYHEVVERAKLRAALAFEPQYVLHSGDDYWCAGPVAKGKLWPGLKPVFTAEPTYMPRP